MGLAPIRDLTAEAWRRGDSTLGARSLDRAVHVRSPYHPAGLENGGRDPVSRVRLVRAEYLGDFRSEIDVERLEGPKEHLRRDHPTRVSERREPGLSPVSIPIPPTDSPEYAPRQRREGRKTRRRRDRRTGSKKQHPLAHRPSMADACTRLLWSVPSRRCSISSGSATGSLLAVGGW